MNLRPQALAAAAIALAILAPAHAAPRGVKDIVLVHGAFADGSGWKAVADILARDGYDVAIAQPPETSLEDDVAATTRVLDRVHGPAVLVGHSYGGAIITEAGNHPRVKALVYVAAFQPDAGESVGALLHDKPEVSHPLVASADGFLTIAPEHFHEDFAADLPAATAAFMARSQVALSVKAVGAPVADPAWKTRPSYAIVARDDHAINPELERWMYKRSGATTTEIAGSHAVYVSRPEAVARVIEQAAEAAD
jgi:pimeloyl-ACP methyl ester carboxylesterase